MAASETAAASAARGFAWDRPELYQHIARTCERGLFDTVFFADLNYIADTYTGTIGPSLRNATQAPEHDPIPLLSFMAAVTRRIGVASTFSVSHSHPFYAARLWATLDHLTRGRAGWNVVTSINSNQAANYGEERQPTDARYDRAHEFMEVCRRLWESWDEDAVVMDREAAVFADPAKVRRIEYEGRFFKSRGPLNVTRSPQNGPAIFQAGTSPKGQDFAAKYADAIFAIQPRAVDAAAYFASIKGRMSDLGRDPDECRILFGMQPIIGETEAEARERQEEHNDLVPVEGGMAILSAHLDLDLAGMPLDAIMAERDRAPAPSHAHPLPQAGRDPDDGGGGGRPTRAEREPPPVRGHAGRHRGPDGGVHGGGRGRRLHALRHPFPGRDRGVRRPRGPRAPAARPLPHRVPGPHPARDPPPGGLSGRAASARPESRRSVVAPGPRCRSDCTRQPAFRPDGLERWPPRWYGAGAGEAGERPADGHGFRPRYHAPRI